MPLRSSPERLLRLLALLPLLLLLPGCLQNRLVSDYDPVIDAGIAEFAEALNAHVADMAELAGTPAGTYDENLRTYNALDAKLGVLIDRARLNGEGVDCALQDRVYRRIGTMFGDTTIPPDMRPDPQADGRSESACNVRLLELVRLQLDGIREIHRETDDCGPEENLSCIPPAAATDALAIANQSIRAVMVVEADKKSGRE